MLLAWNRMCSKNTVAVYLAANHSGSPSLSRTSFATERFGRALLSSKLDNNLKQM